MIIGSDTVTLQLLTYCVQSTYYFQQMIVTGHSSDEYTPAAAWDESWEASLNSLNNGAEQTPVSPPFFERKGAQNVAEYNESDHIGGAGSDIDQRNLSAVLPAKSEFWCGAGRLHPRRNCRILFYCYLLLKMLLSFCLLSHFIPPIFSVVALLRTQTNFSLLSHRC